MMSAATERRPEWRLTGIIFFGLLAAAVLWATWLIVRPFVTGILLGAMLVTITFPLFRRVRNRLRGRANLSAFAMLLFLLLVIIIPAVVIGVLLVQQANLLVAHLQSGTTQRLLQRIDIASRLDWVRRWIPTFDPQSLSPQRLVLPVVRAVPGWVARNGPSLIGGVVGALIGFAAVLLSAYFFYVDGESILGELAALSPLPPRYNREFGAKFRDVIDATFRGHLLTALAQGAATAIGLEIAQVPGALFWGFVATVLSLLPLVGAPVVWVPAAIYLSISASMGERTYFGAIFLVIWGLIIVHPIDNIIRPWVMRGNAKMPAIPLLFSVLGGMQAFGFVGLVIGPLVFSLLMSIIDIYKRSFRLPPST